MQCNAGPRVAQGVQCPEVKEIHTAGVNAISDINAIPCFVKAAELPSPCTRSNAWWCYE
jgi:hypothetical protein